MLSVSEVFEALNESGINYCHWKSTVRLKESFLGQTDFDLLVDRKDARLLYQILNEAGFKRRLGTSNKIYPGMEDYLGWDETTGVIHHFHIHYDLIIGKKFRKNIVLPFTPSVLDASIEDEIFPIRTIIPEQELIIFITRIALKTDLTLKNHVKRILGRDIFPKMISKELDYLLKIVNPELFRKCIHEWFGDHPVYEAFVESYRKGRLMKDFLNLRKDILKGIGSYTRYSKASVGKMVQINETAAKASVTWVAGGGCILSFIGCDGSGKSSTVSTVESWLSGKLSVKRLYMGLPRKNRINQLLIQMNKFAGATKIKAIKRAVNGMQRVNIARFKYQLYIQANQLKNQGHIVIFDRYPLKAFWEMPKPIDGPRMPENTWWGKLERSYLEKIGDPDHLFLMYVTEEESVRRKPEHSLEKNRVMIREKIGAIDTFIEKKLDFCQVIDTVRDQGEVITDVKRRIWNLL
ncbi:MAG: hypothetical protein SF052_04780 [Bacteroidia bacterium]|nr:hypothetical protein [Bacteroidia bacterium]